MLWQRNVAPGRPGKLGESLWQWGVNLLSGFWVLGMGSLRVRAWGLGFSGRGGV